MLERHRREFLREPQGGRYFWGLLVLGCFLFGGGLLFLLAPPPGASVYRAIGGIIVSLTFILWAASELLPAGRRKLIIVLRSVAVAAFFVALPLIPLAFAAEFG